MTTASSSPARRSTPIWPIAIVLSRPVPRRSPHGCGICAGRGSSTSRTPAFRRRATRNGSSPASRRLPTGISRRRTMARAASRRNPVERWAGALGGYRLVLVNGAYAPQSVRRRVARRACMCPVCGRSWPRTRRPWSRISAGSPARSAGVHGAEHGFPPGRRVRVDPAGHDHRTAHSSAVRVGIARDRQRVAPAHR